MNKTFNLDLYRGLLTTGLPQAGAGTLNQALQPEEVRDNFQALPKGNAFNGMSGMCEHYLAEEGAQNKRGSERL